MKKEKLQKRVMKNININPKKRKKKKQEYGCERYGIFLKTEKKNCKKMVENNIKIFLMIKNKSWLNIGKIL